jgi:hypothetical protein
MVIGIPQQCAMRWLLARVLRASTPHPRLAARCADVGLKVIVE